MEGKEKEKRERKKHMLLIEVGMVMTSCRLLSVKGAH